MVLGRIVGNGNRSGDLVKTPAMGQKPFGFCRHPMRLIASDKVSEHGGTYGHHDRQHGHNGHKIIARIGVLGSFQERNQSFWHAIAPPHLLPVRSFSRYAGESES